ncbi:unnamed protein product, partial [Rotaria magnacalcarata]
MDSSWRSSTPLPSFECHENPS